MKQVFFLAGDFKIHKYVAYLIILSVRVKVRLIINQKRAWLSSSELVMQNQTETTVKSSTDVFISGEKEKQHEKKEKEGKKRVSRSTNEFQLPIAISASNGLLIIIKKWNKNCMEQ